MQQNENGIEVVDDSIINQAVESLFKNSHERKSI